MNRDKKNIDRLFEQGLKGYKESPPVYAWSRLDADLDKVGRRKALFYLRLIAASVIILIAFGAGYFYAVFNINSGSPGQLSETGNAVQPVVIPSVPEAAVGNNDRTKQVMVREKQSGGVNNKSSEARKVIIVESERSESFVTAHNKSNNLFTDNSKSVKSENTVIHKLEMRGIDNIEIENEAIAGFIVISAHQDINKIENYNIETEPLQEYGFGDNNTKSGIFRWTVGAQAAPVNSYRDISTSYSNGVIENEEPYNNSEESITSLALGVDVNYSVSKRISFQTGMYYSKIGQINNDALSYVENNGKFLLYSIETSLGEIDYKLESMPSDIKEIDDAKDTIDLINQLNVKVVEDFDIFEVPLMLRYKVLNKKFSVNVMGGISPAFVTNNNAYLEVDTQKYNVENSDNINSVFFNSSLSLGMEYSFLNKLSLSFEPTFKYALSPINKDGKFDYHPYSISWFTGIKYKF